MSDILKSNEKLRICKIFYNFKDNVNSITNNPDRFHKKVEFTKGMWFEIQTQKAKINYSEPPEKNVNGVFYNRKLNIIFPSEKDADLELFENLSLNELVLKLEYNNGSAKLFGDLQQPVICLLEYASGQDTELTLAFTSPSESRSAWLT